MDAEKSTISDKEKCSRNGKNNTGFENVTSSNGCNNLLLDNISLHKNTKSNTQHNKKRHNTHTTTRSLQWMFSRFGLKTRSRCEVVCAGPSGVFKQVKSDETRLVDTNYSLENPEWPAKSNQYEMKKIIGFGATAKVYEATCIKNGRKCAIKKIFLDNEQVSYINLWKETRGMMLCHHDNILDYYTSFVDNKVLWLVLGYMNGGSVLDIIEHCVVTKDCVNGILEEKLISSILKQVIQGLDYIHSHGIIHRDIKAGNILYNLQGNIKIADFGVSTHFTSANDKRLSFIGTPCWMAPEVIQQHDGYNVKADIWSLGITAIEMATGKVPNQKDPTLEVIIKTLRNSSPTLESVSDRDGQYSKYSSSFRRFVHTCLKKEPENRAAASQLLKTSLIKNAGDAHFISDQLLNDIGIPPCENRSIYIYDKSSHDTYKQDNIEWEFADEVSIFDKTGTEGKEVNEDIKINDQSSEDDQQLKKTIK